MGRGAQAQATAQKTQAITNQDSFQLVKCLIRVSVYHVCWMRGLFPEGSFTGHDLAQLDHLHVKMLEPNPADDEASTLKNWVEQGVMDAVSKGYLKHMYFGIAQDAAATNLLEEYIYSFKYGSEGVEFEMAAHTSKKKDKYSSKGKERTRPGVDDVRYQVVRLMRMLVQLCQTLDKVPEERYLFIKLTYYDHTPDDYEPPFFHGVAEEGIGHFHRRPFSMDVGAMDTHHHQVSVRVKSVLESCEEDEGAPADDALMELQGSQQVTAAAAAGAVSAGGDNDDDDAEMEDAAAGQELELGPNALSSPEPHRHNTQQQEAEHAALAATSPEQGPVNPKLRTEEALALLTATEEPYGDELMGSAAPLQDPASSPAHQSAHNNNSQDVTALSNDNIDVEREGAGSLQLSGGGAYEAVRSYCLGRSQVCYVDLMAAFYQLSDEDLGRVLDGLVTEGLLQAGPGNDSYTVLHPTMAAPGPQPHTTSEGIMAEAPGATAAAAAGVGGGAHGSGGSVADTNMHTHANSRMGPHHSLVQAHNPQHHHKQQQHRNQHHSSSRGLAVEDQLLTQQMSGLSVGAAAAGVAARDARGMAGANASVYAAAMRAGSLMTGQPGPLAAAPTAATPQVNPAAAGDEPSVQLQQDQQQTLWFDASQQSFQGPHNTAGAGAGANAGGAGEAAGRNAGKSSRLRKASYVNSPIYQHPKKRGPGSRLHEGADGDAGEEQEQGWDQHNKENGAAAKAEAEAAAVEAAAVEAAAAAARGRGRQQQVVSGATAPDAAAAGAGGMQAPARKKVAVRKNKKGGGTAGGASKGRMAAMQG